MSDSECVQLLEWALPRLELRWRDYFDAPLQRRILDRILDRLVPGGFLVLGAHEELPDTDRARPAFEHLPMLRRVRE
jgi:hypothetical protein